MNFVAPSALKKRPLDEIAPPLSTDAPASALPTKIPAHVLGQPQLRPSQQQQQYYGSQQQQQMHQQYGRQAYGSPPHPTLEFQHANMNFQPQLSPMLPNAASTPANVPPGRMRYGYNIMDVHNKSPRKAPTKSRRMSIEFDEQELKTPVVLPVVNKQRDIHISTSDAALIGERNSAFWTSAQAVVYPPGFIHAPQNEIRPDVVMGTAASAAPPQQPQPQQPSVDQKESKISSTLRVTKPVALRGYKSSQPNPPTVEPALPTVSEKRLAYSVPFCLNQC